MDFTNYNFSKREKHWQEFWEKEKIFQFDPNSEKPLLTVDTPPPTVSGSLHLGHVFSYTQAEVMVRFFRMAGYNVRYPIGFDNNGLPTERLAEKEKGVLGRSLPLESFTKLCQEVIEKYTKKFEHFFKILGFSFDWRLAYSTISPEVQRLAQTVFLKLYKKGLIYQKSSPALYCSECQTPVAAAEVEDKEFQGIFYDVAFSLNNKDLIISTTRPELIPACVAIFVNPADHRYKDLIGKIAKTPFGEEVAIFADEKVQIEKGTGVVMCCTYGDETDVYWVRAHNLAEKIIIGKNGKFVKIPKLEKLEGKTVAEARELVVSELKKLGKIAAETRITHDIGIHERCGTPIEIINTNQWFVKILQERKRLLNIADKINWYPAYMKKRYNDWVENLKWDWSVSRERFFGIPVPVYKCQKCGGVILPKEDQLPIDPRVKKSDKACTKCKSSEIEADWKVLDTWFTSALTPDINNNFPANGRLTGKMYPMSFRPQAHDIIRTWAFYTIVMAIFNHDNIPWKDLVISGHILLQKGQKISKKLGGGPLEPENLILENSADAVRFAMCSASLGRDSYFDMGEVEIGKKLVTKLLNVGKFFSIHLEDFDFKNSPKKLEATDLWILQQMAETSQKMSAAFKKYEFFAARKVFEDFFWNDFCDNYLEIIKSRLYGDKSGKRKSAQFGLFKSFLGVVKMAAPFLPHITEEIYQNYFRRYQVEKSIHQTLWPKIEFEVGKEIRDGAEIMLTVISQVRKYKSDRKISLGTEIGRLNITTSEKKWELLLPFLEDIKGVTRATQVIFINSKKEKTAKGVVINL